MKRYVRPKSRCRSLSRLRICAWIETSSAETGSSQTISFGAERERAGDADSLALAARELVRVAVREARVEADHVEQLADPDAPVLARADPVHDQRLADDVADRHARVERRVRVLEDDLHLAPHLAELLAAELRQLDALEPHRAGGRLQQLEHAVAGGRLARSPDSPTSPSVSPGVDREAHLVDRCISPTVRSISSPARIGKRLTRFLTSRRTPSAHAGHPRLAYGARSLAGCADRTQWPLRTSRSSGICSVQESPPA